MISRTRFSITIPAYKRTYLKDAIDSCLSQTYQDFELVIVNDASPEDLDSIIANYKDDRIRYYRNEKNCGAVNVVDNWNKCLEYATGDYIVCMGDDDILLPNCLYDYSILLEKYPNLGVYHAWTQIIDEKGDFVNITEARPEYESVYSLIWHRWDNRKKQFIGDFLFDAKRLRQNGGFYKLPLAWASDDLTATIAAIPNGIANTQRPCFSYRVNPHTISSNNYSDIKMMSIIEEKKWYETFLKVKPDSELDVKYWDCICRMMPLYYEKKKGLTIAKDLKCGSLFRLVYWIKYRKKYDLTIKILVYSIIQSFK